MHELLEEWPQLTWKRYSPNLKWVEGTKTQKKSVQKEKATSNLGRNIIQALRVDKIGRNGTRESFRKRRCPERKKVRYRCSIHPAVWAISTSIIVPLASLFRQCGANFHYLRWSGEHARGCLASMSLS